MSNPTPTPPQNTVPKEPGFYWATYRSARSSREVAYIFSERSGSSVRWRASLCGRPGNYDISEFKDFSPRITETPTAPVAGDALAEIEQLRGIVEQGSLPIEIGDGSEIQYGLHVGTEYINAYYVQFSKTTGTYHRDEHGRDVFPVKTAQVISGNSVTFATILDALAWLRSPEGKAAVAATKEGK